MNQILKTYGANSKIDHLYGGNTYVAFQLPNILVNCEMIKTIHQMLPFKSIKILHTEITTRVNMI